MLALYNTLTRRKQPFKAIKDRQVLLYTCGLTVYDYAHIGNFRAYIFEDVLRRALEYLGYNIKHVQNFTDVGHLVSDEDAGEDKMEVGAKRERKTAWQIADMYIGAFKEDVKKLRLEEPTIWVRATDEIDEMIELIKRLEEKKFTYKTEDGIYFDTSKLKDYGKLAKLNAKGLKAGARVEVKGKKNHTDFALWKFSPQDKKRDMEWQSPWGKGFPGWHIECSAIAMKYLGETIDIHCGGVDHIAVHHTNEIAQSEAITGKKFANFWLHNEHMLVDGKKMSKSLGNFYTLKDLKDRGYSPLALRYLLISAHYRTQMNFTFDALTDAQNTLDGINEFVYRLREMGKPGKENSKIITAVKSAKTKFQKYVEDDLNMPQALSTVFDMMKIVNKEIDAGNADTKSLALAYEFMMDINRILQVIEERKAELTAEEKKLMELREQFRAQKDFRAADEIRKQLKEKGVILEDTPRGAKWKKI